MSKAQLKEAPKTKGIPFHPPLFAAFPILSIYSANLAIIPFSDLWRPLGIAMALSLPIWLACTLLARNLVRGATAASVISATLVLYHPIAHSLTLLQPVYAWYAAILAVAIGLAYVVKNTYWLNVVASLLAVVSLGSIGLGELKARADVSKVTSTTPMAGESASAHLPDIFYIILDGYGREDALKRVMGFDNSAFIDGLKKRGFYVADKSHSNYVQTEISLSSSLNVDFIPELAPKMAKTAEDRTPFDRLINDNRVGRFLRSHGYRTFAVTSGFPALRFNLSDVWLEQASSTTLFETTLVQMSPFVDTDTETESQFIWRRSALLGALKNVQTLAEPGNRPRFVFVHILAPHPPFVFGPKGEVQPHHGPFGYWDGSDFMTYVGNAKNYRDGYVGQAQYLNGKVLETLDKLLASPSKPIVLVQGDHGSKLRLDQNDLSKTDVTECFENLSAYYVPDSIRGKLYPSITPVNSFRIILSNLFGADLPNLPDRSWYSPFAHPYDFTDVTDRVTAPQK